MSEHYVTKCKHGVVLWQCRCPAKDKTVRLTACPPQCAQVSEPIKPATAPATDEQLKIWQERPCGDTQCRCTELHLDQAIARIQSDAAKLKALELERDTIQEYADRIGANLAAAEGTLKERDEQIANLLRLQVCTCLACENVRSIARRKEADRGR